MTEPNLAQRVDALRSMPLFAGLNTTSLERIVETGTEFEVPKGHVLVQPHMPGSGMFVIEEGTVAVEKHGKTIELGPGECCGELSLLTDRARNARVRAVTPVRCLAIGREDFRKLLAAEPAMGLALLEVLATRLSDTS